MTAVLPLTEDEERELRRSYGVFRPSAGSGTDTVLRLLATLDAERARRAPEPLACDVCGNASDDVPVDVCRHCYDLARSPMAAPPHSRSEAKRLAAQRGEPAPVFDAAPSVVEGMVEREGRPHTFWTTHRDAEPTGTPCSCFWGADHGDGKYIDEEYPASVVEAVRALGWALEALDHGPPEERRDHTCGPEGACDADCMDRARYAAQRRDAGKALAALPAELLGAARRGT